MFDAWWMSAHAKPDLATALILVGIELDPQLLLVHMSLHLCAAVQAIFFVFCEPPSETVGKHPHLGWARPCGLAALHKAKPGAFRQVVSDVWHWVYFEG